MALLQLQRQGTGVYLWARKLRNGGRKIRMTEMPSLALGKQSDTAFIVPDSCAQHLLDSSEIQAVLRSALGDPVMCKREKI